MNPRADGETKTEGVAGDATTAGDATQVRAEPVAGLESGDRVGRYVVRALLGAGAMGQVYRAWDPDLDRLVAIKLLHRRRATVDARLLMREAQALAQLSHPNVIAIYDVGVADGVVFIAMELVEGVDLATWLARPRTLAEILDVFAAAARGLAAAHAVGIVHRDFKPANVLIGGGLSGDGVAHVRVADFGLARMQADLAPDAAPGGATNLLHTQLTGTGFVMGTPAYMAPEVHAGATANAAADQYAFFVALFEAVYGRRPFGGPDIASLVARKRKGLAQLPDDVDVPAWLGQLLLRGLDRDPAARFGSVADVLAVLERNSRARGRGRWVVVAGAMAVLATAGVVVAVRGQDQRCAHVDELVQTTWNPARADALTATIATHDAELDGVRLRGELDAYATRWHEAYREQCERVPELGKVPWQQLDPDVRCLRHQWLVFDALLGQLEGGEGMRAIAGALAELPAPSACVDARDRPAGLEPPPEQLVAVEDLRARADAVEALSLAARYREAFDALAPIEADAAVIGFAPLRVELLAMRGYLHDYLAEYDAAAQALEEVVYEAEVIGDDRLAARSMRTLLFVVATHQNRVADAHAMLRHADALADRAGDPRIAAEMAEVHASVALSEGDLATAEQRLRDALAIADEHDGPRGRLSAQVAANLGNVLLRRSRPGEAEPLIRRALELQRSRGITASVANSLSLLGIAQFQLGRYRESWATQLEALELRERLLGPDHPRTINIVRNLGAIAVARGDFDIAEGYARRVIDAVDRTKLASGDALPIAYLVSGQVALVRGDWARSEALLARALEYAGEHGPGTSAHLELATLARACGRFDEALASIEDERIADAKRGDAVATPRTFDVDVALVELARGDADEALARMRTALAEIGSDSRIEVQQVAQRAGVVAALAARRANACADAVGFAEQARRLELGDEGEVAWWRALAWAEAAAARRCLGDEDGAHHDFAEMLAVLGADASAIPELFAAQRWWDLRVPDVAQAWEKDALFRADAPRRGEVERWIAAHRPNCPTAATR